ncbi:hypothetical protein HA39_17805 [Pantoea brenneri]|nr:hypothetical protein HA39_17805 [Pantoea brenneri]
MSRQDSVRALVYVPPDMSRHTIKQFASGQLRLTVIPSLRHGVLFRHINGIVEVFIKFIQRLHRVKAPKFIN